MNHKRQWREFLAKNNAKANAKAIAEEQHHAIFRYLWASQTPPTAEEHSAAIINWQRQRMSQKEPA